MFIKSRKILAIGTAVTVATAGVAIAGSTGAELNDAEVVAKVTPSKLSKKKFTPVNSLLGVVNSPDSAGNEDANAEVRADRDLEEHQGEAEEGAEVQRPRCRTAARPSSRRTPARRSRTWAAATVHAPPCPAAAEPCLAAEPIVSVFNGPDPGQLRLHTYSATSGPRRRW